MFYPKPSSGLVCDEDVCVPSTHKPNQHKTGAVLALLSVLIPFDAFAQTDCDARLFEALKSHYKLNEQGNLHEVIKNVACQKSDSQLGVEIPDYIGIDVSQVRSACQKNDRQFFANNSRELTYSFLPVDVLRAVIPICSGSAQGLTLAANEDNAGTIRVTAKWGGAGNVPNVRVQRFVWPQRIVDCSPLNLETNARIGMAGVDQICYRKMPGDATFSLTSDGGSASAIVAAKKAKPTYTLKLERADDALSCTINGQPVASSSFNTAPGPVDLTPFMKEGTNSLRCVPVDVFPNGLGQPCWSYSFSLSEGQKLISNPSASCCGSLCGGPTQINISLDY